jgi:hypothetical protein
MKNFICITFFPVQREKSTKRWMRTSDDQHAAAADGDALSAARCDVTERERGATADGSAKSAARCGITEREAAAAAASGDAKRAVHDGTAGHGRTARERSSPTYRG